jgi:hypothetical protein
MVTHELKKERNVSSVKLAPPPPKLMAKGEGDAFQKSQWSMKAPNLAQTCKFIMEAFPCFQNIQTFHGARREYFEQLFQFGRLQILHKIHVKILEQIPI